MRRLAREVCPDCGEIFRPRTNQTYCAKCNRKRNWRIVPEPEDKGTCVCPKDGLDYKIHECDIRRRLARERKEQNKPYVMAQCADCTPEKAEPVFVPDGSKNCRRCNKKFMPVKRGEKAKECSEKCRLERHRADARARKKRMAEKRTA